MSTTAFIHRHIARLPEGRLFTTRDVLLYGSRSAVDSALFRLVKSEVVRRLARGVFIRIEQHTREPSVDEIATIKAESFGRLIACHGEKAAMELGLIEKGARPPTYAIDGRSSSFRCGSGTVYFKAAAQRKMKVGDGVFGSVVRALWHIGKDRCDGTMARQAKAHFKRPDIEQNIRDYGLLPSWMHELLRWPQLHRVKHLLQPLRLTLAAALQQ